jgi:hypothetical protein
MFASANASIRKAVATSKPVVVAEFFHHICTAILEGLFATNSNDIGILGDLSNHFGVDVFTLLAKPFLDSYYWPSKLPLPAANNIN